MEGHYALAVLLQELYTAKTRGETELVLDPNRLHEDPVVRLKNLIQGLWWDNLTRHLDADGILAGAKDPKMVSCPKIYVPKEVPEQYAYYRKIAAAKPEMNLEVHLLPEERLESEYIKSLRSKSGILALEMDIDKAANKFEALPYIVPGDRFNELYNWDSALACWGLLESHPHLVESIIRHFIFEIKHYGKILNANRTYYLGRAQPPLLTDLALRYYEKKKSDPQAKELLRQAIAAAMKEYDEWWTTPPRQEERPGLARYRPIGSGLPPECEPGQFNHVLSPYAKKYGMDIPTFFQAYNDGKIHEDELDIFCLHDRSVRESGHDVSNRVEGKCADLYTVDLNCLLYKIEKDVEYVIGTIFNDNFEVPQEFRQNTSLDNRVGEQSYFWGKAAADRKELIDNLLWNEQKGLFFDFNAASKEQTTYESVTTFWAMWSGVASEQQASLLIENALPLFEKAGGLCVSTERSRGPIDATHPQKQWDYPYGWPPHQLFAWEALEKYGYKDDMERIIYRWLYMMITVFVNFNGTVVEKYNVTQVQRAHKVVAEYGNQGSHFKYAPLEG